MNLTLNFSKHYSKSIQHKISKCPECKNDLDINSYDDQGLWDKDITVACDICSYCIDFKDIIGRGQYILWRIVYGQYSFASNKENNLIKFPIALKEFARRMPKLAILGAK